MGILFSHAMSPWDIPAKTVFLLRAKWSIFFFKPDLYTPTTLWKPKIAPGKNKGKNARTRKKSTLSGTHGASAKQPSYRPRIIGRGPAGCPVGTWRFLELFSYVSVFFSEWALTEKPNKEYYARAWR
jgi:hypothetical protein